MARRIYLTVAGIMAFVGLVGFATIDKLPLQLGSLLAAAGSILFGYILGYVGAWEERNDGKRRPF